MRHKCFVSYKQEDLLYKRIIQTTLGIDMIDKSLNEPIDSTDENYIMRRIREGYLSDSTVTIHLIGEKSAENLGSYEQRFIKRELQASLYNGENNTRNGLLGIVLPSVFAKVYQGSIQCGTCFNQHSSVNISDATTIREFSSNYYIPHGKCSWSEEDRYCVLVDWNTFCSQPEAYIELAYNKRTAAIASSVIVRP